MNFKSFHLGTLIKGRVEELDIASSRLAKFLNCTEEDLEKMYISESLDIMLVLRWSKILNYDFFRIYSHHLILYSPKQNETSNHEKKSFSLPQFRKNIYSEELIDYILEIIDAGRKTKLQVIDEYKIPKTTLYKWIAKRTKLNNK